MYEPTRGGTRGGQAEFKWSDVSADKDREHYLGHSINAPTGRWQKNKDVHWYNRDKKQSDQEKADEIERIREAEREALAIALGFKPTKPIAASSSGDPNASTSGANAIPVAGARPTSLAAAASAASDARSNDDEKEEGEGGTEDGHKLSKEEKRLRKIEKKLAKAEKKRQKREEKEARAMQQVIRDRREYDERTYTRQRGRERSASPHRLDRSHARDRDRSRRDDEYKRRRSHDRSTSPHARRERDRKAYDEAEMERERARDRRRWEDNLARQERARGNWD